MFPSAGPLIIHRLNKGYIYETEVDESFYEDSFENGIREANEMHKIESVLLKTHPAKR